jgi:HYR domain
MTRETRIRTSAGLGTLVLGVALAAATAAAPSLSEPQAAAGNLGFRVTLRQSGPFSAPCPGGRPLEPDLGAQATACVEFTGTGPVRGLGNASMTYTELLELGPPACPGDFTKQLATTGRLSLAGKGAIIFTFAQGTRCTAAWLQPQEFTITGGTGRFARVSGTGRKEGSSVLGPTETWTGTLAVPGLAFDVTAPKMHGAGSKTVRAEKGYGESARVTFKVTASDRVDGAVPVYCRPRSGSRFLIGRTTVRCKATDSSGNVAATAFTVEVK